MPSPALTTHFTLSSCYICRIIAFASAAAAVPARTVGYVCARELYSIGAQLLSFSTRGAYMYIYCFAVNFSCASHFILLQVFHAVGKNGKLMLHGSSDDRPKFDANQVFLASPSTCSF